MATVRVNTTMRAGTRRITLKPSASPVVAGANAPAAKAFNAFRDGAFEATAVQLRVMAEEARELIVQRLYASHAQAPGEALLPTPPVKHIPGLEPVNRSPARYRSLTREHVRRKRNAQPPQDGRFLIATGDYLDGIEVKKLKRPDGGPYYVVRLKARKHFIAPGSTTTKPITLMLLARILEFGSRRWNIPPRPHWRPALRDIKARFQRLRRTIKAMSLRASLRRIA